MDLHDAAAHLAIQQVLYRYCRGVDRGDAALIAGVYWPEAVDRHGAWEGPGKAFADHLVPRMDQAPRVGQHHVTNILIELRGELADVESYFIALHPEAGQGGHSLVCGRYVDRFEQRDGVWLIAERQVVIDVSRVLPQAPDWPGAVNFPAGGRRSRDPSHGLFAAPAADVVQAFEA